MAYTFTKIIDIDFFWLYRYSSINYSSNIFSSTTRNVFLLSGMRVNFFPSTDILCVYFKRHSNSWNTMKFTRHFTISKISNLNFIPTKFHYFSQKVFVAFLPLSIQSTIMLLKTSSSSNYFRKLFIIIRRRRIRNHCCVAYTSAELTLTKQQSQLKLMEIV